MDGEWKVESANFRNQNEILKKWDMVRGKKDQAGPQIYIAIASIGAYEIHRKTNNNKKKKKKGAQEKGDEEGALNSTERKVPMTHVTCPYAVSDI